MAKRYSEQTAEDRHQEMIEALAALTAAAERIAAALENKPSPAKPRRMRAA